MTLFDQGGIEVGEVIDEVAEFIKRTKESDPDYEYDQGSTFTPPKHDNDDGWLTTGEHIVPECDADTILIKKGPKRKHWAITYVGCGRCQFSFERTKVSVAREWAQEHNEKNHSGELTVIDSTKPDEKSSETS